MGHQDQIKAFAECGDPAPETSHSGETARSEPPIKRVAWRIKDVARTLGVSRATVERHRASGRLPKPDVTLGRMPMWRPETIQGWIEQGGGDARTTV